MDASKLDLGDVFDQYAGSEGILPLYSVHHPTKLAFKIPQHVTWVTENPGGQFLTGSFQPIEGDWSEQAYRHLQLGAK